MLIGSLYRYRKFNKWALKEISENTFYAAAPREFNDPFDCRSLFSIAGATDDDIRKFLLMITQAGEPKWPISQVEEKVDDFIRQGIHRKPEWQQHHVSKWMADTDQQSDTQGVICFSELSDDLLMWAHYTDYHSGFCLEFNKKGLDDAYYCKKVMYRNAYPSLREFTQLDLTGQTHLFLLSKSDHWTYEYEWRILHGPTGLPLTPKERVVKFAPELLTGVIFGCQMLGEHRKKIRKLLKNRQGVTFYEAVKAKDNYRLDIRQC